jgi:hypothetical protein
LAADAVTFDDGLLRFTLPVQDQTGNPVPLQFEGRVVGGKMEGHLSTPGGGRIAVTGERGD